MSRMFRVAIDGPGASGKSTTAKLLAKRLGFCYIDSGAMYRAVTLKCLEQGINPNEAKHNDEIGELTANMKIRFPSFGVTEMDGRDVSELIRRSDIVRHISPIAANPRVRETLAEQQRALARGDLGEMGQGSTIPGTSTHIQGVVMDGRDIGTVILPDAELKVFLIADPYIRAKRRFDEMVAKGQTSDSLEDIVRDLKARDEADRTRTISPLKKADDAVELDTSHCSIADQVEAIQKMVYERAKKLY
ncbi:cytidylate kinase [Radiomyces spectabilis]|uniref:cytidylate kinase n=1 Tax=Radiomyces spectabilis TaxID=64574 RepID=UPI0022203ED9|nr:cytidylate kinase [Radiomyces spectabilis]KAI8370378.1 cytidylate kinase [Radiomyces spectabilis]